MLSDVAELFDNVAVAPAADRRLTRRFVDLWARAARGRYPSWEALQQMELGDDLDWMFVVDYERSIGFPFYVHLGERLAKFSDVFLCGASDFGLSLLNKATDDIFSAVSAQGPHFREETQILCDGRQVHLRSVTAPLADDGETITHVVGAVNGRFAQSTGLHVVRS